MYAVPGALVRYNTEGYDDEDVQDCPTCHGTGVGELCRTCHGFGELLTVEDGPIGVWYSYDPCWRCLGTGVRGWLLLPRAIRNLYRRLRQSPPPPDKDVPF